jgi:isopentenyl diphosphate isomerase/L-lactate dehydrogenase-like FMN-dependent dehydrogenase
MADDAAAKARFLTTTELVAAARKNLSDVAWDYICGGAETETTLLRNRYSLDAIAFRPRVLRNVESTDVTTEAFGAKRRLPVLLAPLGGMTEFHEAGAAPSAAAAREFGCLMMLSSVTEPALEVVAKAAGKQLIYQLYVHGDDRWVTERVKRAADAGVQAFCVTVDVAHYGRRERSLMSRHALPGRPVAGLRSGEEHAMRLDWPFVAKLKRKLKVPLILKGVATAEDATLALENGVDVVYVSNHGGRQLDHGRGSMDMLSEVMSTVRGKAEVIVDGGFMRGTDILKALAMGASLVGLGRLQALAVAAAGRPGVVRMLELLETELSVAMKMLGATKIEELDGSFLHPTVPVGRPDVLGAFPLLGGLSEKE